MSMVDEVVDRLAVLTTKRSREWTPEEDDFLRRNLGFLSDAQIGQELGRSEASVHLRWKRNLKLPAPSKDPRFITGRGIAGALGVDEHRATHWIDSGMLPGRRAPGPRAIRLVSKPALVEWATDPENWVHFDPEKVRDPNLRRLALAAKQTWGDEWWNTGQVADYLGVTVQDVKRYIQQGRIRARRVLDMSGRHPNPKWGHWFVLRSEAMKGIKVIKRQGNKATRQESG